MIVADTNTIAYLYLSGDRSGQAEQLFKFDPDWLVPILWRSEFRSVMALYLRKNLLPLDEVLMIIRQAEKHLRGNEREVSSSHVMQLVAASGCSAYDCEFAALAKGLAIPLITADKQLIRAFPGTAFTIEGYLSSKP